MSLKCLAKKKGKKLFCVVDGFKKNFEMVWLGLRRMTVSDVSE